MAEQQRNMDYLNSTGDKFVKSLPRQKSEQLRSKLADLNDKWRDINLHAEKRQNQVRKNIPARFERCQTTIRSKFGAQNLHVFPVAFRSVSLFVLHGLSAK